MRDCCLTPSKHFVIYMLARQYGNMLVPHTHTHTHTHIYTQRILFQVSIDIDSRSNPEKEYIKYYRVDTTKVVHIKAEQSYIYVMTEETVRYLL